VSSIRSCFYYYACICVFVLFFIFHLLPRLNPDRFTFLVPADPGCPGKRPLQRCSSSNYSSFICVFYDDVSGCLTVSSTSLTMIKVENLR